MCFSSFTAHYMCPSLFLLTLDTPPPNSVAFLSCFFWLVSLSVGPALFLCPSILCAVATHIHTHSTSSFVFLFAFLVDLVLFPWCCRLVVWQHVEIMPFRLFACITSLTLPPGRICICAIEFSWSPIIPLSLSAHSCLSPPSSLCHTHICISSHQILISVSSLFLPVPLSLSVSSPLSGRVPRRYIRWALKQDYTVKLLSQTKRLTKLNHFARAFWQLRSLVQSRAEGNIIITSRGN